MPSHLFPNVVSAYAALFLLWLCQTMALYNSLGPATIAARGLLKGRSERDSFQLPCVGVRSVVIQR